jgi:dipeptidyl aminopeptidase/acylaminoacyl peptidase
VEAISTNNDLWIVPVSGGPTKNITADNPAADETPVYSPDGKFIAYRAQKRPGYESDRWRLMLDDRKAGGRRTLRKSSTDGSGRLLGHQIRRAFTSVPKTRGKLRSTACFSRMRAGTNLLVAITMIRCNA